MTDRDLRTGLRAGPRTLFGISVTRALGLILVPLVTVGVFLWGLWNPMQRLHTVQAAVVNLDEPVEIDGQITPLGRVLAAELIGNDSDENFEWVLTDTDDAHEGLDTGSYITVVTIPENFSAAATSLGQGPIEAQQAHITVDTSERARLLDAALAGAVTETATRIINEQLGTAVLSNVFVGMRSLGEGLDQVTEGAEQLSSGLAELTEGLDEFAAGTEQLSAGVGELAVGTQQLAEGVGAYALGVDEFAAGAHQAAAGSHLLAAGVQEYTDTVNSMVIPIHDLLAGQVDNLLELRELFEREELPLTDEQRERVLGFIDDIIAAPEGLAQLIGGGEDLAAGTWAQVAGLDELAEGASDLAAGAHGIAGGAHDLAGGTGMLAGEMPALVDGARQLADGVAQTTDGSEELVSGLSQIAGEVPRYTDAEAQLFAELAMTPVAPESKGGALFSGSGAPLFLTVALWAGALVSFMLLAPLWGRTREAALGEATITLRSGATAVTVGGLQGILAGALVAVVLGLGVTGVLSLALFGVLIGVAFNLVNQGLVALLGGPGRLMSFALLIIAFVAGIVSTVPGVLGRIVSFTPIGSAMSGVQRVIEQGTPGALPVFLVLLWAILGVVLIGAAVNRARKTLP